MQRGQELDLQHSAVGDQYSSAMPTVYLARVAVAKHCPYLFGITCVTPKFAQVNTVIDLLETVYILKIADIKLESGCGKPE